MNQKNFDYLRDQVKYTGFGNELDNKLAEAMEKGPKEFKLVHESKYGDDSVTATLNFSQSKKSDMYFFNSYDISIHKPGKEDDLKQTFYINKGNSYTLKEAYNLMEGRSVNKNLTNKEGQEYNAWVHVDFKQTDNNGNYKLKPRSYDDYNLEAILARHPIKELANPEYKSNLIESLKKGNLQSATFQYGTEERKQYIEASPQFGTVNIYNTNMQRIDSRLTKGESHSEGESNTVKQDTKKQRQAASDDDAPEQPPAKKRRNKQSIH